MIDTKKVRDLLSRDEYAGAPELVIRELCDEIDRLSAEVADRDDLAAVVRKHYPWVYAGENSVPDPNATNDDVLTCAVNALGNVDRLRARVEELERALHAFIVAHRMPLGGKRGMAYQDAILDAMSLVPLADGKEAEKPQEFVCAGCHRPMQFADGLCCECFGGDPGQ